MGFGLNEITVKIRYRWPEAYRRPVWLIYVPFFENTMYGNKAAS